jgi:hypothetical protein
MIWRNARAGRRPQAAAVNRSLQLVRALHTAIYVVMASACLLVAYAGVSGRDGPWLWPALALAGLEAAVFLAGGLKCPLTAVVARLGGEGGRVSDTFFPERLTRHTLAVFGPVLLVGLGLLAARRLGLL